jgi:hypothetical protein
MTKPYTKTDSNGTYYFKDEACKILHNDNGPAIERSNGDKHWYLNGVRHRVDGPAIEYYNGYKSWYLNGERHRIDGPAVDHDIKQWWLSGKFYSEAQYYIAIGRKNLVMFI